MASQGDSLRRKSRLSRSLGKGRSVGTLEKMDRDRPIYVYLTDEPESQRLKLPFGIICPEMWITYPTNNKVLITVDT